MMSATNTLCGGHVRALRWAGKLFNLARRSGYLFLLAIATWACTGPQSTTIPGPSSDGGIDTPDSAPLQVGTRGVSPTTTDQRPRLAGLTTEAMAGCPLTFPNGKSPPGRQPADFYLGNEDGALFTILWPGGKVIFTPSGPGFKKPDGSLIMKWSWYRTIPGDVVIGGKRLDASSPPIPTLVLRGSEDGYGETGFQPTALLFPSQGCWEITARVGDASLSFVTLAIRISFDPAAPQWLPPEKGLTFADSLLGGWPNTFGFVFRSPDGGEVIVETSAETRKASDSYPAPAKTYVQVRDSRAVCTLGELDRVGEWQPDADAAMLEWQAKDLRYRISSSRLGLRCQDLLEIAFSLRNF